MATKEKETVEEKEKGAEAAAASTRGTANG